MDRSKAMIAIDDIELGYTRSNPLFPKFSIDAFAGELIALVGRNGIGKSTLIRTINGQQSPLSGSVNILGINVSDIPRQQRAKLLSYVPAEPVKVNNLFIRDFVAVGRFPYVSWTRSLSQNDWELVDQALSLVGISHLALRDITTVSDGERQRAMIAFALAQDTKIILLDEPTAFLDLPNKFEMVRLLSQLAHQKQKTIIYSTHDLQGAIHEADIVWMMLESGFISGAPEDLALRNNFQELLANTQLVFDIETGVFKNFRALNKEIALEGKGDSLLWTQRTLQRLGFQVVNPNETKLKVTCSLSEGNLQWKVTENNNVVFVVDSITELSRKLRMI